jgi:hypothetical protein
LPWKSARVNLNPDGKKGEAMLEFDKFLADLEKQLAELAKSTFKENWQAAVKDGQDFLDQSKAKLQKYLKMLNNGEIDQDEFKSLAAGLSDLAEMEMLKQAGLKAAQIDQFRTQVINLVIDAAFKFIV